MVGSISRTKHDFPHDYCVLSPSRELLVLAKICVSLLHPKGYGAMLAIDVIHNHQSWKRTFGCFPLFETHMTPSSTMKTPSQDHIV